MQSKECTLFFKKETANHNEGVELNSNGQRNFNCIEYLYKRAG